MRFIKQFAPILLGTLVLLPIAFSTPVLAMQKVFQSASLTEALVLDVYTNEGGAGANATGGVFHPGDIIFLYANITYYGDPVAQVLVSFEVMNPLNADVVFSTAVADSNGIAKINFTVPSAPPNALYGTWKAIATTSVAQMFASDNMTFQVIQQTSIPGDVNGDGHVDISDVTLVILWWNQPSPPAPANVDINHDGVVDISDAAIIGLNWLKHT